MIITLIIILSYVAYVFLCRYIFRLAFKFNRRGHIKDLVTTSLLPAVGLIIAIACFVVELEDKGTWFNGKNW